MLPATYRDGWGHGGRTGKEKTKKERLGKKKKKEEKRDKRGHSRVETAHCFVF